MNFSPLPASHTPLESRCHLDLDGDESREYRVPAGVTASYFFLSQDHETTHRIFRCDSGSCLDLRGIVLEKKASSSFLVIIEGEDITVKVDLLGLATPDASLQIEGCARVLSGSRNIEVRVDQTNILLGDRATIRGRPVLEIATDTISGGHSCRIHRISGESLFYLQSHGVDSQTAETLLIQSEIWSRLHLIDGYPEQSSICSHLFEQIRRNAQK